jgi:hypothetical protein
MTLSKPVVSVLLLALLLAALVTRHATTNPLDSPYFKGTAAMDYRHAMEVADGVSLSARDLKAAHPAGYAPARVRASGVEVATGYAFRLARFFGENDGRRFTRRLTALCAALCVFTAYALARGLWDSQAAGLTAAFLIVFLGPLVGATNGREFSHTVFAMLLGSLHAVVALRALARRSIVWMVGAAVTAAALCAAWEPAAIVVLAWIVPVALSRTTARGTRVAFAGAHAAALLVAGACFPHLVAARALAGWTTALALASVAVAALPERRRRAGRAAALLIAGTAVLTALSTPLRAGAPEQFPAITYLFTRLRFLFGRPESATQLSDWMRSLWSLDHAPLAPHPALQLFAPLGLLAAATLWCRSCRERRPRFVATGLAAIAAAAAVATDRSALPVATIAMIPFAAGGVRALRSGPRVRPVLVALGGFVAFASVALRGSVADPTYQLAKAAGVAYRDPGAFVWVSLENTDRELIRFVATRTSVSESILAPGDLSALLLAFSGRTIVQLPGATSRAACERHVAVTRALYGNEQALYEMCRSQHIDYVLYSIDVLLDAGPYSPRYLAGVTSIDPASIAFRMHFDPASIRNFTLLYENDHYRVFKVTAAPEPVFLTDHPLFYQPELFVQAGRNLDTFRERVVHLMITCVQAMNRGAAGDVQVARTRLAWCVKQAPRFTRAHMALADVLISLGRYQDARAQVADVLGYAPDHSLALYYAAYLEVQLERPEAARPYLTLLFAQERDPALLQKARALQSYIDNQSTIKPAPPQGG